MLSVPSRPSMWVQWTGVAGVADKSESRSGSVADNMSTSNATWRTSCVKRTSWAWLSRQDMDRIRSDAIKFISRSSAAEDARIEWYVTWPKLYTTGPNGEVDKNGKRQLELRVLETGNELLNVATGHGLDVIISQIAKREKRRPRTLRYVKFTATAPDREASLSVGGPSGMSRRIMLTCDAPGTGTPESSVRYLSSFRIATQRGRCLNDHFMRG